MRAEENKQTITRVTTRGSGASGQNQFLLKFGTLSALEDRLNIADMEYRECPGRVAAKIEDGKEFSMIVERWAR